MTKISDKNRKYPVTIGVYIIKSPENWNCYVGSSIDIESRHYEHIKSLKNNRHHSKALQRAYN
jgi:predicted GIY-YIG superfamily endonuclease